MLTEEAPAGPGVSYQNIFFELFYFSFDLSS